MERRVWSLTLAGGDFEMAKGKTQKLTPVFNEGDTARQPKNTGLVWKCSGIDGKTTDVVTVANGVVSAKKKGTAKVWAESVQKDKDGKTIKSNELEVEVYEPVSKLTLNKTALTLMTGDGNLHGKDKLKVTIDPSEAKYKDIEFESSNSTYLTVDQEGNIETTGALPQGVSSVTVKVTVRAKDGSGKNAVCTVTIKQRVQSMSMTQSIKLMQNKTYTLQPILNEGVGTPSEKGIIWKSSNEAIATVSANGAVKGLKEGTVTITATSKDNSAISATCEVEVFVPITSFKLDSPTVSLKCGESKDIGAISVMPVDATYPNAIEFKSLNTTYLSVTQLLDENGKPTGKAKLSAADTLPTGMTKAVVTVTARTIDGSNKSVNCTVTISK